jgi:single-strand DNA-binding protein
MAANDTTITIVGNLTDDPELRFTPTGVAMAKFRIASTPRMYDKASSAWKDGEALFMVCTAWRDLAENIAESLIRGARVVATGRLRQSRWETPEGEKRSMIQLDVDEIGPSLRFATATVKKLSRSNGKGNAAAAPADDPWATPSAARPADSTATAAGGGFADDEPPF